MANEHPYRDPIPPLSDGHARPRWSVMVPTYNARPEYLREALTSVLEQDPGPDTMQIEVVDNCSDRTNTEALVREIGSGRVDFYRQPENVGHIANFNTCLQRSRGELVHVLHDDDAVRERFYETLAKPFAEHPEIGAAFCRHIIMDEHSHWQSITWLEEQANGVLKNWLQRIIVELRIQFVAIVVRRNVFEKLGGFDRRLDIGNDWEMWIRIANRYPVWYETEPLALHRFRSASLGRQSARVGEESRGLLRALEIARSDLNGRFPDATADLLFSEARENVARSALWTAGRLIEEWDMHSAMRLVGEALRSSRSRRTIRATAELLIWVAERQVQVARGRLVHEGVGPKGRTLRLRAPRAVRRKLAAVALGSRSRTSG